jgi:hypothetical protein
VLAKLFTEKIRSGNDRIKSEAEGWDTPEGMLARWIRLHRVDWVVNSDRLAVTTRPKPKKEAPPVVQEGPRLFGDD